MTKTTKRVETKYGWASVGDVITGTKNGRRWTATVGASGKLVGRVFA